MTPFDFNTPSRLIFGRGVIARLPEIVRSMGERVLIIANGPTVGPAICKLLDNTPVHVTLYRQQGEPTVSDIEIALDLARHHETQIVIGAGGGSAIDTAKAVAGLLTNPGAPTDYMEVVGLGKKIANPALPWIAVPTTAGTGAEATRNAVIGLPEKKFKASIRSELLLPRLALIDPALGIDVPPSVTAASGMDALCQLIESYTSSGATPLTDTLALDGIARAARALPRAFHHPHDLDAREDMALAAYLSGVCLTNAGLGAVHGFAAPLGANFPVPHGVVCAALLPHVIATNIAALQSADRQDTLQRYATIGRLLANDQTLDTDAALDAARHCTTHLAHELHIPRLSTFGLKTESISAMVELAKKASSMRFNPIALDDHSLAAILTAAI